MKKKITAQTIKILLEVAKKYNLEITKENILEILDYLDCEITSHVTQIEVENNHDIKLKEELSHLDDAVDELVDFSIEDIYEQIKSYK